MKPLWLVTYEICDSAVVAANSRQEAENILFNEYNNGNYEVDDTCPLVSVEELMPNKNEISRFYKDQIPYGTDEYITTKEYLERYEKYLKEKELAEELDKAQLKLFEQG
jgi:hypothetical protein